MLIAFGFWFLILSVISAPVERGIIEKIKPNVMDRFYAPDYLLKMASFKGGGEGALTCALINLGLCIPLGPAALLGIPGSAAIGFSFGSISAAFKYPFKQKQRYVQFLLDNFFNSDSSDQKIVKDYLEKALHRNLFEKIKNEQKGKPDTLKIIGFGSEMLYYLDHYGKDGSISLFYGLAAQNYIPKLLKEYSDANNISRNAYEQLLDLPGVTDPQMGSKWANDLLVDAMNKGNHNLVRALLKIKHVDPSATGNAVLRNALSNNMVKIAFQILNHPLVNLMACDESYSSFLDWAYDRDLLFTDDNIKLLERLLDHPYGNISTKKNEDIFQFLYDKYSSNPNNLILQDKIDKLVGNPEFKISSAFLRKKLTENNEWIPFLFQIKNWFHDSDSEDLPLLEQLIDDTLRGPANLNHRNWSESIRPLLIGLILSESKYDERSYNRLNYYIDILNEDSFSDEV